MLTQMTVDALLFEGEATLPLEVQIPSLHMSIHDMLSDNDKIKLRLQELESFERIRLVAWQNLELYHQQMSRSFD